MVGDTSGTTDSPAGQEPNLHNFGYSVMIGNKQWQTGGQNAGT